MMPYAMRNATPRHATHRPPQVSNATAVYVRRPGNAKKFKAEVVCEGKMCDLALLTVRDDAFWDPDMRGLTFVDVPELQVCVCVCFCACVCVCLFLCVCVCVGDLSNW